MPADGIALSPKASLMTAEEIFSIAETFVTVSYTHLRAHETVLDLVCRLLLEKKKKLTTSANVQKTYETYNSDHEAYHTR